MPGGTLRPCRSIGHLAVSHREPFRNNFIPSRRHCRQEGPNVRAIYHLLSEESAISTTFSGSCITFWCCALACALLFESRLHLTTRGVCVAAGSRCAARGSRPQSTGCEARPTAKPTRPTRVPDRDP